MRRLTVAFPILTAMILAGCDTGDYFPDDESAGIDSGRQDSVSLPDVATQPDPGNTSNELRLYKSGSRIKAKVLKTADGAQGFAGWYDVELETDCYFRTTKDGKTRATPASAMYFVETPDYYSDSNCTKRIYHVSGTRECPYDTTWVYTPLSTEDVCQVSSYRFYRNSSNYAGTRIYHRDSDEVCIDATESVGKYIFLSKLGEEVDPSIFAEVTLAIVD